MKVVTIEYQKNSENQTINYLFVCYMNIFACIYLCVHCACSASGDQKTASDSLGLEITDGGEIHVGAKN